jgi:hypothetical protein
MNLFAVMNELQQACVNICLTEKVKPKERLKNLAH